MREAWVTIVLVESIGAILLASNASERASLASLASCNELG